ncbi:sodium:proton antiporter [Mesotoga sp. HF07.pep.5.2.highcov]|uniref:Putative subunit of the multisubunit Na+/H+ antiporter n=1 Tax=Mesotoga prima MesG1.Ag.4.2 TaxID=660470 RepID=I2F697_9BACT|nr:MULTISPECIES: hydrogenase subunit MbhD domain-containing protein [Mesotoga]MDK2944531.1 energy-converting hydrogenase subunit [Mesotoga sp.]AFK07450.1 putative subunit of the multisubunit Na+/H+ antiporter [Mesotoga prima MesG1.Ag.4.2]PIJ60332.1 sodium:proton antiporter [Mesotoga sp. H07.pep.5.3]RLL84910.1 sodium:proton antiporter [Mesotoga sp. H07pep.5.4]RLL92804.1 sodium:proton antiporter [Mesotoga sp. HF07.pep.5.2.highcov]
MNVFSFIIGVVMVGLAIFAIEANKLLTSVIMLSAMGLLSVILFVIMKAPDVAITEASVGAGLTTAIFLLSLRKLKRADVE